MLRCADSASRSYVAWACFSMTAWTFMLRHATGCKLANDGMDTWTIKGYLGHRNITHAVRYTELARMRFKGLWK